jgi:hypothetical protein
VLDQSFSRERRLSLLVLQSVAPRDYLSVMTDERRRAMSTEWFTMKNTNFAAGRRHHPLADPLEGEEWKGLGWATAAIAGLLHVPRGTPPQKHRKGPIPLIHANSGNSV